MKNSEIKWVALVASAMASFLLATGSVSGDDREPPSSRIIGGDEAQPGEFPFMAALTITQPGLIGLCGCSIIDEWHVLTAAHCVTGKFTNKPLDPRDLKVEVGCHLRTECSSTHAVSRVMVHHAWNGSLIENGNDIAVLKLKKEIKFDSLSGSGAVSSIALAPSDDLCCDEGNEKLIAVGWGLTEGNATVSYVGPLMKASLDSNLDECMTRSDKLICTRTSGKNICNGDSGGPLIRRSPWGRFILVGVSSFVAKYCNPDLGGFFTKVSAFRDWIEQCTDDGTCQAL